MLFDSEIDEKVGQIDSELIAATCGKADGAIVPQEPVRSERIEPKLAHLQSD